MFASTSQPTVTASLVQFIFQWISYSFEFGIIVFGYWFRHVGISSCAPLELVLFGLAYIVIKYFAFDELLDYKFIEKSSNEAFQALWIEIFFSAN